MLRGRCRQCNHIFVWDQDRYSIQNHVISCKQCGTFLGGGFKCSRCEQVVTMIGPIAPEECVICQTPYEEPLVESI
jgi:hypothetical protein